MPNKEFIAKRLDAKLSVKEMSDTGEFEGYASTYAIDQEGEKIAKGAWKRTLSHTGGVVPILFGHDTKEPCGWNHSASEDEHGLFVKGRLSLETEIGKKAYYHLKGAKEAGARGSLSVGFRVIKEHVERDPQTRKDVRIFDEVSLMEYSVVVFPANLEAMVTAVKAQDASNLEIGGAMPSPEENKGDTREVAGHHLTSSHFAYVGDPKDPSTYKLPIYDAGHVRNALARFNQTEGIPEDEKPAVLARIHAAAHRFGIDVSESDKAALAALTTKDKVTVPPMDFDAAVDAVTHHQDMMEQRNTLHKALSMALDNIHQSDMPLPDKHAAVKKAYIAHGTAMGDWHCKAMLATDHPNDGDESYGHVIAYADSAALTGKGDSDALYLKALLESATLTKGKMPAAKKAAMLHALSLHSSAIDLHHKGMKVIKSMFDDSSDDGSADDGTEMGAMSANPEGTETKGEMTPEEVKDFLAGLRSNLAA